MNASAVVSRPNLVKADAYIAGQWTGASSTFEVTNPATGEVLATLPRLGAQEATSAVAAAHSAFASWREQPAKVRADYLKNWYGLIIKNADDLARLLTAEQGKPLAEAKAEVAYAASFVEWFAEEARRVYGDTVTGWQRDKRILVLKQPVGVVAAITPWNFPLAMITRKAGPALAVGCTFVLKPSELTPLSALALAALAEEAGLPPGVFNVVMGDAPAIGDVFTGDPRVRKLSFTGSTAVGKMLAARCAATVKRVSLELGGNAPFIVFPDADLEMAATGAVAAKFRNTGQTCVCANRLLVHQDIHDSFVALLRTKVEALKVGDGLKGETHQGPLINKAAVDRVTRHVDDAVSHGATVVTGGRPLNGNFYAPTVLANVAQDALLCREETFGPVAGLIKFASDEEAVKIANDTAAGLAAYVYSRDPSRLWRVCEALEYGMIGQNTGLISSEIIPFGGVKESGYGREGSRYGMDDYLSIKALCQQI